MKTILDGIAWVAAVIIIVVPVALAFDFGGMLGWSQSIASFFVAVAGLAGFAGLTVAALKGGRHVRQRNSFAAIIILLWLGFLLLQTQQVSPEIARWLSPGTYLGYTEWVPSPNEASSSVKLRASVPLSVDRDSTKHVLALASLAAMIFWSATWTFDDDKRAQVFLVSASLGVTLQAIYIIWCSYFPSDAIVFDDNNLGVGAFVNPHSAGLFLNLGLACSVGTAVWRHALQERPIRDKKAPASGGELLDYLSDPVRLTAIGCAVLCSFAILVTQSGVAVFGLAVGGLATVRWFKSRGHAFTLLAVALVSIVTVVFLLASEKSASVETDPYLSKLLNVRFDTRLSHWPDGVRAALNYLPFGSGAGSYGQAYRPFQATSVGTWYANADNYWIELAVEQGLPGIVFSASLFWIIFFGSRAISVANEFVDKGVRAAACFAAGAILATQTFDFGITLPANLFLFAAIAGMYVARSQVVRRQSQPSNSDPKTKKVVIVAASVGILLLVATLSASLQIRSEAFLDYAVRSANHVLQYEKHDRERVDHALSLVSSLNGAQASFEGLVTESELLHQQARLDEVDEQSLDSAEAINEAYRMTSKSNRRLNPSGRITVGSSKVSDQKYQAAWSKAWDALQLNPYSITPRTQLIYLDFAATRDSNSVDYMRQLAKLLSRNPNQLVNLAELAKQSGENELASQILHDVVNQAPTMAPRAVSFALASDAITIKQVIPDAWECQLAATKFLMRTSNARNDFTSEATEFLASSVNKLNCDCLESNRERSECEFLAGAACLKAGMADASVEHMRNAIQLTPASVEKRLAYVSTLRELSLFEEARLEARKARALFPDDDRFQAFLEKLAAGEVERAQ